MKEPQAVWVTYTYCKVCNGSGIVLTSESDAESFMMTAATCPKCKPFKVFGGQRDERE